MTTSTGALPDVLAAVDAPPGPLAGLAAASRRPVHAYLLVGPPGAGAAEAASTSGRAPVDVVMAPCWPKSPVR